jgi:hypothetical protein
MNCSLVSIRSKQLAASFKCANFNFFLRHTNRFDCPLPPSMRNVYPISNDDDSGADFH